MRVLIADRDEVLLNVLQSDLWACGHEAEIAAHGPKCLVILREFIPDVVVLDLELSGNEGHWILDQMRNNPVWSEIPVILTSSRDVRDELGALAHPQMITCLQKPFWLHEIMAWINACRQRMTRRKLIVRAP